MYVYMCVFTYVCICMCACMHVYSASTSFHLCYIFITHSVCRGVLRRPLQLGKARVSHEFARIQLYVNDIVMRKTPKF